MAKDSSKTFLDVPRDDDVDDYTASIELSNACREFYRNRVKATENFKQNMSDHGPEENQDRKKTSIDDAMETLRSEMASLMEQDLSLMKQLLNLNEAIEDLKVKRLYYVSKDSLRASSQDMHASDWSCSEMDMYESEADMTKSLLQARLSHRSINRSHSSVTGSNKSINKLNKEKELQRILNGLPLKVRHGQQNSIDSGYGDDDHHYLRTYKGPVEVTI